MADEKKINEETNETVEMDSEESRREFMTKVMGAAGAIAAAGVIGAAASGEASAAEAVTMKAVERRAVPMQAAGAVALRSQKLDNGLALKMSGKNIGDVLQREGLLPHGASPDKVAVKLELST